MSVVVPPSASPAGVTSEQPALGAVRPALAYLAPRFPERSETFVYREVLALRARGWQVRTLGLHAAPPASTPELVALARETHAVYGAGALRLVVDGATELALHPVRGARTVTMTLRDVVAPGEPLALLGRLKLLAQAGAGLALARRLRSSEGGPMHVHAHFAHATASVAMYAAAQLGVPFSFTGHANDLFQRRALLKRKLQRAAFVACISEWHHDLYQSIEADGTDKYRVIRCAVDVGTWAPASAEPRTGDPLRLLFVGRLVEKKGVDTLIEAVAALRRQGREVRVAIAGDGPMREPAQALAQRLGCADLLQWHGAVDNDEVRRLMAQADVFALPCRTDANGDRDGIPVVLMEAMACGLPVVSGDLPAIRELVHDDRTGCLVPGGDAAALATTLEALLRDPARRSRLGAGGRARVRDEFAQDVNIERLDRAFRQATRSRRLHAGT